MNRFFAVSTLAVIMAAAPAIGATITAYTDSVAFGSATAVISNTETTVEGFNASSSSTFNIVFNINPLATSPTVRGITGGVLLDEADQGRQQNTLISMLNGQPMYALGALWNLSPNGVGSGLRLQVNFVGGGSQTLTQILGVSVGGFVNPFFFGFTSDQAISSILILPAGPVTETFSLDNLTAASTPTEPQRLVINEVPEPSTLGLTGLALVGIGFLRPRRKSGPAV